MTTTKNVATSSEDANKIIPRAEFRVFGRSVIADLEKKIWDVKANLFAARVMPEEIYFLSKETNEANVKVRDNLLDIKIKVGETPEGYEIFQPRGKFEFPVKKTELAEILTHLKVDIALNQEQYTLDEFIKLANAHHQLSAVRVEKMRYGFMVNGIICEYAKVWFNGAMVETACCESENYTDMKQVVELLGIASLPNTNYLKAAKQVIGIH